MSDERFAPANVATRIGPDTRGGRWLVTTQGSQHVWDLDEMTYQRMPGEGRGKFDYDGEIVTITRVERWPEIGGVSLVYYDDPAAPEAFEQVRRSSLIEKIEKLP